MQQSGVDGNATPMSAVPPAYIGVHGALSDGTFGGGGFTAAGDRVNSRCKPEMEKAPH